MAAAEMGTFGMSRWQLSKDIIILLASDEVDANRPMRPTVTSYGVLRASPAERASSMPEVRSRRRVDRCNVVASGDNFEHPHCRFRQTVALPSMRQSKCAGDPQTCAKAAKGFLTCCNAGRYRSGVSRRIGSSVRWLFALLLQPLEYGV
jgi:hypothetical protein